MKQKISFLFIYIFITIVGTIFTACDKTDDPGGETPSAGTVKDADGNVYSTVKIGTQVWTVENLKTTKYNDGTSIPNVTDNDEWANLITGAYCNYDNLESNVKTYGRLYNWYAVETGKLATKGWHVPTHDEWTILENYLIANGYNYDDPNDKTKIAKSLCGRTNFELSDDEGTPGYQPENNNSTGFTALPGGYRFYDDGEFDGIGEIGYWWSSTEDDEGGAFMRSLGYVWGHMGRSDSERGYGFSVRLVKD